jgi:putative phosphoesterase
MKHAIISDIHDNLTNLEKCLKWCNFNSIGSIICCGDITSEDTLKFILNSFSGMVHLVEGNMEIYDPAKASILKEKNLRFYGPAGRFESDGLYIGICHEPYFIGRVSELGKCDIIFYGHTHKPWIEEKGGVKLVNPGTLGGVFQKATFAVWNTNEGSIELMLLEKIIA